MGSRAKPIPKTSPMPPKSPCWSPQSPWSKGVVPGWRGVSSLSPQTPHPRVDYLRKSVPIELHGMFSDPPNHGQTSAQTYEL